MPRKRVITSYNRLNDDGGGGARQYFSGAYQLFTKHMREIMFNYGHVQVFRQVHCKKYLSGILEIGNEPFPAENFGVCSLVNFIYSVAQEVN